MALRGGLGSNGNSNGNGNSNASTVASNTPSVDGERDRASLSHDDRLHALPCSASAGSSCRYV